MLKHLDWLSVLLYIALVSIGWVCIYATGYNEQTTNLLDFSQHATKQLFCLYQRAADPFYLGHRT